MKRTFMVVVLLASVVLISSCSSFSYLFSDDYLKAGIRVTTNPADVKDLKMVNRWSSEFTFDYNNHDVGVWAANRLAKDGRHDLLVLVEVISAWDPPYRGASIGGDLIMWRISVYSLPAEDAGK
jgi:hypothetical protein